MSSQKLGEWEKYTKGFGSKYLEKFNFKGRLGKDGSGIAKPIEVRVRPKNAGISSHGSEKIHTNEPLIRKGKKRNHSDDTSLDNIEVDTFTNSLRRKKIKKIYKLNPSFEQTKTEIIDMTKLLSDSSEDNSDSEYSNDKEIEDNQSKNIDNNFDIGDGADDKYENSPVPELNLNIDHILVDTQKYIDEITAQKNNIENNIKKVKSDIIELNDKIIFEKSLILNMQTLEDILKSFSYLIYKDDMSTSEETIVENISLNSKLYIWMTSWVNDNKPNIELKESLISKSILDRILIILIVPNIRNIISALSIPQPIIINNSTIIINNKQNDKTNFNPIAIITKLFKWSEILSFSSIMSILQYNYFPKLLNILNAVLKDIHTYIIKLNTNPRSDNNTNNDVQIRIMMLAVIQWYSDVKSVIPNKYRNNIKVQKYLQLLLVIMNIFIDSIKKYYSIEKNNNLLNDESNFLEIINTFHELAIKEIQKRNFGDKTNFESDIESKSDKNYEFNKTDHISDKISIREYSQKKAVRLIDLITNYAMSNNISFFQTNRNSSKYGCRVYKFGNINVVLNDEKVYYEIIPREEKWKLISIGELLDIIK